MMPSSCTLGLRRLSSLAHSEIWDKGDGCTMPVSVAVEWQAGPGGSGQWPGDPAMLVWSPLCPDDPNENHVSEHRVFARHFPKHFPPVILRTVSSELWTVRCPLTGEDGAGRVTFLGPHLLWSRESCFAPGHSAPDFLTVVISLPGTYLVWATALLPTLKRKTVVDPNLYLNTHRAPGPIFRL